MYKLIAIDLDGTLLNSYGQISEENKNEIQKAVDTGVHVVLTSGRVSTSIKNLADEVNANKYLIAGNGALVYDIQKDEKIYKKYIEKEKALKIIRICEENSIYYNIYTEDTIITKSLEYSALVYHHENYKKNEEKRTRINLVENIEKYIEDFSNINILKITICDNNQIIFGSILKKVKQLKGVDILEVSHMSRKVIKLGTEDIKLEYYYTEITSMNVNKWEAIKYLINELNIGSNEVIAIGDNINDEIMIKEAGLGIAMGNSNPYIKQIADEVVNDNNSSGVAEVIKKYVNI